MKKGLYSKINRLSTRRGMAWVLAAMMIPGAVGCALPRAQQQASPSDRMEEERRLGDRWAQQIVGLLKQREDQVLTEKMVNLATKLGVPTPPQIAIFSSITSQQRLPVFVLPGYRWYFSSGALRALKYDNELAAALAAAQALSELMSARNATESAAPRAAVPSFSESEWRSVNLRMVDLLYRAGYDPRGVPRFWQKAKLEWSGVPPEWSSLLQDEAFSQISRRAPLMNPVVRSTEFGEIEKRLRKL